MKHQDIIKAVKAQHLLECAKLNMLDYNKLSLIIAIACNIAADVTQLRQLSLFLQCLED
jgi:hypothetical protein